MINQRKLTFKNILLVNLISNQMLRVWFIREEPNITESLQLNVERGIKLRQTLQYESSVDICVKEQSKLLVYSSET